MRQRKLFIGQTIRNLRETQNLTQAAFAKTIGISTSYLNQIENNQRHISANVLVSLAEHYDLDIASLSSDDADRRLNDVLEVFADPALQTHTPGRQELLQACQTSPNMVRALIHLHQLYRKTAEQVSELDDLQISNGAVRSTFEEVRDFFHYQGNYFDEIDRAAEDVAAAVSESQLSSGLSERLAAHGIKVVKERANQGGTLRRYDPLTRSLFINSAASQATQTFEIAHHLALVEQSDLIKSMSRKANFQADDAASICEIGLANYFAGAVMLPYSRFYEAAKSTRHDLELLADEFGCSLEQVAHRLSTLQRPHKRGTPFFFARVDQAGNITKRHSATSLQFARFGSACPLWNVHQAFETPNRIQRQLAETPDGNKYLCLAVAVTKRSGGFKDPVRRYALALGCEIRHAGSIVYADDLPIEQGQAYEPIGVSCRICERAECHQRSVPPIRTSLHVDRFERGTLPYQIG
tara:strand:+ start:12069 stop:13469 length:1401 start_codon:yes stop_codon:yes gene_type:complete